MPSTVSQPSRLDPSIPHEVYAENARAPGRGSHLSPAGRAKAYANALARVAYYRRLAADRGLSFYRGDHLLFARNHLAAARSIREAGKQLEVA